MHQGYIEPILSIKTAARRRVPAPVSGADAVKIPVILDK